MNRYFQIFLKAQNELEMNSTKTAQYRNAAILADMIENTLRTVYIREMDGSHVVYSFEKHEGWEEGRIITDSTDSTMIISTRNKIYGFKVQSVKKLQKYGDNDIENVLIARGTAQKALKKHIDWNEESGQNRSDGRCSLIVHPAEFKEQSYSTKLDDTVRIYAYVAQLLMWNRDAYNQYCEYIKLGTITEYVVNHMNNDTFDTDVNNLELTTQNLNRLHGALVAEIASHRPDAVTTYKYYQYGKWYTKYKLNFKLSVKDAFKFNEQLEDMINHLVEYCMANEEVR